MNSLFNDRGSSLKSPKSLYRMLISSNLTIDVNNLHDFSYPLSIKYVLLGN